MSVELEALLDGPWPSLDPIDRDIMIANTLDDIRADRSRALDAYVDLVNKVEDDRDGLKEELEHAEAKLSRISVASALEPQALALRIVMLENERNALRTELDAAAKVGAPRKRKPRAPKVPPA